MRVINPALRNGSGSQRCVSLSSSAGGLQGGGEAKRFEPPLVGGRPGTVFCRAVGASLPRGVPLPGGEGRRGGVASKPSRANHKGVQRVRRVGLGFMASKSSKEPAPLKTQNSLCFWGWF